LINCGFLAFYNQDATMVRDVGNDDQSDDAKLYNVRETEMIDRTVKQNCKTEMIDRTAMWRLLWTVLIYRCAL
jgi:Uri superfamily endonuclease